MDPQNGESANRVGKIVSRAAFAANIFLLAIFAYLAAFPRVKFRELFVEFEVELPLVTEWLVGTPTTLWLVGLAGIGALLLFKELLIGDAIVKLTINLLIAMVLLILASVAVIALFEPLTRLINSLS